MRGDDRPIFRRQHAMGAYILDFYCVRAKLCVEVDGYHHTEDEQIIRDIARDNWLKEQGIKTYRISAADVFADVDSAADGIILLALSRL